MCHFCIHNHKTVNVRFYRKDQRNKGTHFQILLTKLIQKYCYQSQKMSLKEEFQFIRLINLDNQGVGLCGKNIRSYYSLIKSIAARAIQVESLKAVNEMLSKIESLSEQIIKTNGEKTLMGVQYQFLQCILWYRVASFTDGLQDFYKFCLDFFKGKNIIAQLNTQDQIFTIYKVFKYLKTRNMLPLEEVFSYIQAYITFPITNQTLSMIYNLNIQQIAIKTKEQMQFNNPYSNQTNIPPNYPQNPQNYNFPPPYQNANFSNSGNTQHSYQIFIPSNHNPNTFNSNTNFNTNYVQGNQPNNLNLSQDKHHHQFFQNYSKNQNPSFNPNQGNNMGDSNFNGLSFQNTNQLPNYNVKPINEGNTLNVNVDYSYFSNINFNEQKQKALKKQLQLKKKKQRELEEKRLKQEQERREREEEARDRQFEARKLQRQMELKQNQTEVNVFADNQRQELDRGSGRFSSDFGMKTDFGQNEGEEFNFQSPNQINNSLLRFSKKPETNQKTENKE